jgi:NAD(P)-dependent dehydrogenase (short-subunit alcohol dehydrogenase family)
MLCPTVKEENGGLGLDIGFNCVLNEELAYIGTSGGKHSPGDMAGAALFLDSPLTSYITGQSIGADGGLTLS